MWQVSISKCALFFIFFFLSEKEKSYYEELRCICVSQGEENCTINLQNHDIYIIYNIYFLLFSIFITFTESINYFCK